jgi:hypothetical protein
MNTQLLSDIRNLVALRRAAEAAVRECDNHYQAGYDTGYEKQYADESSKLHQRYIKASDAEEFAFEDLILDYQLDGIDTSRAWQLYRRFA